MRQNSKAVNEKEMLHSSW